MMNASLQSSAMHIPEAGKLTLQHMPLVRNCEFFDARSTEIVGLLTCSPASPENHTTHTHLGV